jgi:hypothetical protein
VAKRGDAPFEFAFEAKSWSRVIPNRNVVNLKKIFRQSDRHFIMILEAMRRGVISRADEQVLKDLKRSVRYDDGIDPVEL